MTASDGWKVLEKWCPREDSNLHDLAITSS